MSVLFDTIMPIFVLVALGYVAGRFGGFSASAAQGISRFLGFFALPSLLFETMFKANLEEAVDFRFVASFFLAASLVFLLSFLMWYRRAGNFRDLAAISFAPSFSNMGAIGVPLFVNAYGAQAALPLLILMLFNSPLLFTAATVIAESQQGSSSRRLHTVVQAFKKTVLSPMIIAIIIGFVVNYFHVPVPAVAVNAMTLLGLSVLPCASFHVGASLSYSALSHNIAMPIMLAVMKNALHPALTWGIGLYLFALSPTWLAPAVMAAALPIGLGSYLFAERYQSSKETVGMAMLISTALSPVSVSIAFLITNP